MGERRATVVTAEYHQGEDKQGRGPGGEAQPFYVLALFEDAEDAEAFAQAEKDGDDWGTFPDSYSWSDAGWYIQVDTMPLREQVSIGELPPATGKLLARVNKYRARRGVMALKPGEWSHADLEEFASRIPAQNPQTSQSALKRKLMP